MATSTIDITLDLGNHHNNVLAIQRIEVGSEIAIFMNDATSAKEFCDQFGEWGEWRYENNKVTIKPMFLSSSSQEIRITSNLFCYIERPGAIEDKKLRDELQRELQPFVYINENIKRDKLSEIREFIHTTRRATEYPLSSPYKCELQKYYINSIPEERIQEKIIALLNLMIYKCKLQFIPITFTKEIPGCSLKDQIVRANELDKAIELARQHRIPMTMLIEYILALPILKKQHAKGDMQFFFSGNITRDRLTVCRQIACQILIKRLLGQLYLSNYDYNHAISTYESILQDLTEYPNTPFYIICQSELAEIYSLKANASSIPSDGLDAGDTKETHDYPALKQAIKLSLKNKDHDNVMVYSHVHELLTGEKPQFNLLEKHEKTITIPTLLSSEDLIFEVMDVVRSMSLKHAELQRQNSLLLQKMHTLEEEMSQLRNAISSAKPQRALCFSSTMVGGGQNAPSSSLSNATSIQTAADGSKKIETSI